MNWAIWIDMYTLTCIRLMTNKNLLYKRKIKKNKIQGYIVQHREYSQCFMLKKKIVGKSKQWCSGIGQWLPCGAVTVSQHGGALRLFLKPSARDTALCVCCLMHVSVYKRVKRKGF